MEVAAAVLVTGSVVRGFRHLRKQLSAANVEHAHPHHGVDRIDICIGAMLSVEAYAKYHATGHIPRPTILLAVTMLTVGLVHGRLAAMGDRRRQLQVTEDGISVPLKFFRRLKLAWAEVNSIDMADRHAVITAIDGRSQRIDLGDVMQPAAVREALMTARTFAAVARHATSASVESTSSNA